MHVSEAHQRWSSFPAQSLDKFDRYPYTVWDFFPAVWNCPWDIQRVGRLGDGGKWVCGMSLYEQRSNKPTIMYSFGSSRESSFEAEMLARTNAEIYVFDAGADDVCLFSACHPVLTKAVCSSS